MTLPSASFTQAARRHAAKQLFNETATLEATAMAMHGYTRSPAKITYDEVALAVRRADTLLLQVLSNFRLERLL